MGTWLSASTQSGEMGFLVCAAHIRGLQWQIVLSPGDPAVGDPEGAGTGGRAAANDDSPEGKVRAAPSPDGSPVP